MADVYAVFGTLLALGIAFPGMLYAWWLLFPGKVDLAQARLERTPWRCFFLGIVLTFVIGLPAGLFLALPFGPVKFLGGAILFGALAVASLGAAGIAAAMGERLRRRSGESLAPSRAFVSGAVALELAAAFPGLGWFLVIPMAILTSLGAAGFAVLNWEAGSRRVAASESALAQA